MLDDCPDGAGDLSSVSECCPEELSIIQVTGNKIYWEACNVSVLSNHPKKL
jgi:hypothetical protein